MSRGIRRLAFESLGVRLELTADTPEVFDRFPAMLPPDAQPIERGPEDPSFGVHQAPDGSYGYTRDGSPVTSGTDLDFALSLLETQIRIYIGINATDRIFVHAGVVGFQGRAIVLPGRSFTGKTTMSLALVAAGATYYSDEFGVFDPDGLVHPYLKSPSVRNTLGEDTDGPSDWEGLEGERPPLPVGAVIFTEYHSGGVWQPRELSQGRGTLGLFSNTLAALSRPQEAMQVLSRALNGAVILESERGEAAETAERLLSVVLEPPAGRAIPN